jgi:hypothetical protein
MTSITQLWFVILSLTRPFCVSIVMIFSTHLEVGETVLTSISFFIDLLSCRFIRIKWICIIICPEFNNDFTLFQASTENASC